MNTLAHNKATKRNEISSKQLSYNEYEQRISLNP